MEELKVGAAGEGKARWSVEKGKFTEGRRRLGESCSRFFLL